MTNYILQIIGEVDKYKEASFIIEGKEYRAKLLSKVIKEKKGGSLILLAPESLVIWEKVSSGIDDVLHLLDNKDLLKKRLYEEVSKFLEFDEFDIIITQSVGTYLVGERSLAFYNTFDNVSSYLLIELLQKMSDAEEITFCITTGQNQYVTNLIEVMRIFLVHHKLKSLFRNGDKVKIQLAFHPPIDGKSRGPYLVEITDYDVKAFFDFPSIEKFSVSMLLNNADNRFKQRLGIEFQYESRLINELISSSRNAFNCLKYNAPLALFYNELVNIDYNPEEALSLLSKALKSIEDSKTRERDGNQIKIKRLSINRLKLFNLVVVLGLASCIKEKVSELRENKPTVSLLRKKFVLKEDNRKETIYSKLNLDINSRFLERDLKDMENCYEKEFLYRDLKELAYKQREAKALQQGQVEEDERKEISSDEKRNFFAHSGLLDRFVYVKKYGNQCLLRYDENAIKSPIKAWIKSPES